MKKDKELLNMPFNEALKFVIDIGDQIEEAENWINLLENLKEPTQRFINRQLSRYKHYSQVVENRMIQEGVVNSKG